MGRIELNFTEDDFKNIEVKNQWREKKQIDIVICLDSSGSMEANDFKPNRFEAAKKAAQAFTTRKIMENYHDQVGLLTFGGNALVHLPLTKDLDIVSKVIDKLGKNTITHNSTSLGTAINEAIRLLSKSNKENSKAIILLSDGDNWGLDPMNVILNNPPIPIYTIGIGTTKGIKVKIPGIGEPLIRLNEDLLKKIAKQSGGKYYHAPEVAELIGIFEDLADL